MLWSTTRGVVYARVVQSVSDGHGVSLRVQVNHQFSGVVKFRLLVVLTSLSELYCFPLLLCVAAVWHLLRGCFVGLLSIQVPKSLCYFPCHDVQFLY